MIKKILIFSLVLVIGILSRFYNLNWDSMSMLHPDERFLIMVTEKLIIPNSLYSYLDTSSSTLNPHNLGFNFYVYGTLPIIVLRLVANYFSISNIGDLLILGRQISAFYDVLTAILVFLIARRISPRTNLPILTLIAYFSTTLSLQLSHFFTVDTSLVFFLTLTVYLLLGSSSNQKSINLLSTVMAGLSYGLAISSKISALYLLPFIVFYFIQKLIIHKKFGQLLLSGILFLIFTVASLRMGYPYLFNSPALVAGINPEVIADWKELNYFYSHSTYQDPASYIFPPATMFLSTTPIIFPLINLVNWGFGPAFSIIMLFSLAKLMSHLSINRSSIKRLVISPWALITFWMISIFLIQGVQFLLYLRYFYPIVPAASLLVAFGLQQIYLKNKFVAFISIFFLLIWPISFTKIYSTPHTRIQASDWIYNNLPTGSTIAFEHWDDPLPLYRPNQLNSRFNLVELTMFDKESQAKWRKIYSTLNSSDYLVISSNRVYASTLSLPDRYPTNKKYYELLFSGQMGFTKIAEFSSRPGLSIPLNICIQLPGNNYGKQIQNTLPCNGIEFIDDYSDESFTVYDHPRVYIFKKTGVIPNLGV